MDNDSRVNAYFQWAISCVFFGLIGEMVLGVYCGYLGMVIELREFVGMFSGDTIIDLETVG